MIPLPLYRVDLNTYTGNPYYLEKVVPLDEFPELTMEEKLQTEGAFYGSIRYGQSGSKKKYPVDRKE